MTIVKTTDGRYLGRVLPNVNRGDIVNLDGFLFEVQYIKVLENGNTLFSNPNYQLECEEL